MGSITTITCKRAYPVPAGGPPLCSCVTLLFYQGRTRLLMVTGSLMVVVSYLLLGPAPFLKFLPQKWVRGYDEGERERGSRGGGREMGDGVSDEWKSAVSSPYGIPKITSASPTQTLSRIHVLGYHVFTSLFVRDTGRVCLCELLLAWSSNTRNKYTVVIISDYCKSLRVLAHHVLTREVATRFQSWCCADTCMYSLLSRASWQGTSLTARHITGSQLPGAWLLRDAFQPLSRAPRVSR